MSRISIDVTSEQHQRLKALAALQGKTIKEFVLDRTLGQASGEDDQALEELETLLDARIRQADMEGWSSRSVKEVFDSAINEARNGLDG